MEHEYAQLHVVQNGERSLVAEGPIQVTFARQDASASAAAQNDVTANSDVPTGVPTGGTGDGAAGREEPVLRDSAAAMAEIGDSTLGLDGAVGPAVVVCAQLSVGDPTAADSTWLLHPGVMTLKMTDTSYMLAFPELECFHQILFLPDTPLTTLLRFEDVLKATTAFALSPDVQASSAALPPDTTVVTTEAGTQYRTTSRLAHRIDRVGEYLSGRIESFGGRMNSRMSANARRLRANFKPNEKPVAVPKVAKVGINSVRFVTNIGETVTVKTSGLLYKGWDKAVEKKQGSNRGSDPSPASNPDLLLDPSMPSSDSARSFPTETPPKAAAPDPDGTPVPFDQPRPRQLDAGAAECANGEPESNALADKGSAEDSARLGDDGAANSGEGTSRRRAPRAIRASGKAAKWSAEVGFTTFTAGWAVLDSMYKVGRDTLVLGVDETAALVEHKYGENAGPATAKCLGCCVDVYDTLCFVCCCFCTPRHVSGAAKPPRGMEAGPEDAAPTQAAMEMAHGQGPVGQQEAVLREMAAAAARADTMPANAPLKL